MATNRSPNRKKMKDLTSAILPLVKELDRIKKQAEALGLFTNDRELLQCPGCDLAEDVAFDGRLMTYHPKGGDYSDSGLRFEKLNDTTFRCPICMIRLKAKML